MPAANLPNNRARTCTWLKMPQPFQRLRVLFAGFQSPFRRRSASYARSGDQLNSQPEPRSIKGSVTVQEHLFVVTEQRF